MTKTKESTVAYLGPEGTFSHLVALRRFPRGAGHPCATITEVFHAVASGAATLGIVPIENSSGGTITETVDLLIEQCGRVVISEELALDVRLALLGTEGTPLDRIRTVHSHVMPLRHHRDWIRENLPAASLSECSSTAEAARKAARSPAAAALAAPGAAPLYGLSVLRFPVRPEAVNVTHFFVIAPAGRPASRASVCKTAIVAALPQAPGSLHRFLGPFARGGVNLRRIVSRPVPGSPETYVFYLEVEGDPASTALTAALAGATRRAVRLELLGSYPTRARYRGTR
jgi:prephenate dehydratase